MGGGGGGVSTLPLYYLVYTLIFSSYEFQFITCIFMIIKSYSRYIHAIKFIPDNSFLLFQSRCIYSRDRIHIFHSYPCTFISISLDIFFILYSRYIRHVMFIPSTSLTLFQSRCIYSRGRIHVILIPFYSRNPFTFISIYLLYFDIFFPLYYSRYLTHVISFNTVLFIPDISHSNFNPVTFIPDTSFSLCQYFMSISDT